MTVSDRKSFAPVVLYEVSGDNPLPYYAVLAEMKRRYGARIIVVCRTKEERPHLLSKGLADVVIAASEMASSHARLSAAEIIEKARAAEQKYAINLHYALIEFRQYFTAAPNFPGGLKPRSYDGWLALILDQLAFYEALIERYGVTFVFHGKAAVFHAARACGVPAWRLEACLYEYRYLWTNRYDPSFPDIVAAYEAEPLPPRNEPAKAVLAPPAIYFEIRKAIQDAVRLDRVILGMAREVARHYYYRWRGYDKATVLDFDGLAWARYLWGQRRAYRQLNRLASRGWADVRQLPYVFFPLSAEPELTLSFWSPEYFEQLSTIQQLAKELPVGNYLVVKEHMISIGNRPAEFYETIARMPNVILVDPAERGLDIGSTARAVAVVASTAGTEAALQGIPTLVFAKRTWLTAMGHVRAIERWDEIRSALAAALAQSAEAGVESRRQGLRMKRALDRVTLAPMDKVSEGEAAVGAYLLDKLSEKRGLANALEPHVVDSRS